jgi:hypothetical protein
MELIIIDAFRKSEASLTFGVISFVSPRDMCDPSFQNVVPLTKAKGEALTYGLNCIASGIPASRSVSLEEAQFFEHGNICRIATLMAKYMEAPLSREEKAGIQGFRCKSVRLGNYS